MYDTSPLEILRGGQAGTAIHIHKHNKYPMSGQCINQPRTTREEQTSKIMSEMHQRLTAFNFWKKFEC